MKLRKYTILLAIPFLTLALFSCKKDDTHKTDSDTTACPYTDELEDFDNTGLVQDGLIPLSINNFWVYADSLWDAEHNLLSTEIDTIKPIATQKTGEDIWWNFDGLPNFYSNNDSIFILSPPDLGVGCHSKSLLYYPIESDTTIDWIFPHGYGQARKTYIVGTPITSPAGEFSDCYFFSLEDESGDYFEILKPGIGFVKSKRPFSTNYLERTLIDYYIEE